MKHSVITGSLGSLSDRFVLEGYKDDIPFAKKAESLAKIKGLSGLELSSDPESEETDVPEVKKVLNACGLSCSCVGVPISAKRIYGKGSLGSNNAKVRQKAIDACKAAVDYAAEMGAGVVNIWPGEDGFDYALCCDYSRLYHDFLDGMIQIADYNKKIRIALEFKPREPRNRSLVDTCGTALLMCAEANRDNLGVCVDVGHVLYANANMSNAVQMCADRGKLFHMHMNDCLGYWDDDMILGSVHFIEYIELCYTLRKVQYDGWCSVDIFPNREDAIACAEESIRYLSLFDALVDKIGMQTLAECITRGDAAYASRIVREKIFE